MPYTRLKKQLSQRPYNYAPNEPRKKQACQRAMERLMTLPGSLLQKRVSLAHRSSLNLRFKLRALPLHASNVPQVSNVQESRNFSTDSDRSNGRRRLSRHGTDERDPSSLLPSTNIARVAHTHTMGTQFLDSVRRVFIDWLARRQTLLGRARTLESGGRPSPAYMPVFE